MRKSDKFIFIYINKISKYVSSKLYHIENFKKKQRANSVDPVQVAHDEPPHQDLHCLQIQLFLSLVLHMSDLSAYWIADSASPIT